ncbi:hypothetical protein FQN49_008407, partial [Arthroderma sp. PD_2]
TIKACYLDQDNKIPVPDLYAYEGVPQHMPDPALGSHSLLGLRDDVCFDRFGRYGPYGLGYRKEKGGSGVGLDTESSGNEDVWAHSGQVDYSSMDWGDAQERCLKANSHRFLHQEQQTTDKATDRVAVVLRLFTGYKWTELAKLNLRAMVSELSLKSGGEYSVHLLLHARDKNLPIWTDELAMKELLDSNVPREFHGLVTVWSDAQIRLFYPGAFEKSLEDPSEKDVLGVYRSAHMPLQLFARQHPGYEHYWNWEMDMRVLGSYYELLDRIGQWTRDQQRRLLWERSARYYIPAYHGSWDNFSTSVQLDTAQSGREPVFGPVPYAKRKMLQYERRGKPVLPASCAQDQDQKKCGVGEPADLITLNPIFDPEESNWVFANDVTGYADASPSNPPRRTSIITASRMSRRLLETMHEETWRHHRTMFTEMFPATVALHHGFKASYAPHPVLLERAWQPIGSELDAALNGGRDHSTSGKGGPFAMRNEHNHHGSSWYYNSQFAGRLWRRWLGYAQMHERQPEAGERSTTDEVEEKGGFVEETSEQGSGRMCLRSVLLHPIKYERPLEKEVVARKKDQKNDLISAARFDRRLQLNRKGTGLV